MTTKVTIQFDTGNAAFDDGNGPAEAARILKGIAAKLDAGLDSGTVRDSNGNRVGQWSAEFPEATADEGED